ncbi:uncharacterized protein LOC113744949 [Larimichthys crocea]|uniref:uncharacterized protein LOC113744949 n=1 Tax=Larimichthys crocea TaxID=215358 RepID=UPI000F5E8D59|nr:uncharacterized protein LOC113744949 [Larimichthys crocea]
MSSRSSRPPSSSSSRPPPPHLPRRKMSSHSSRPPSSSSSRSRPPLPHLPPRKMSSRSSRLPSSSSSRSRPPLRRKMSSRSSSPQSPQRPSSWSNLLQPEGGCLLRPGRRSRLPPPPHLPPRRISPPGPSSRQRGGCSHPTPPLLSPPRKKTAKMKNLAPKEESEEDDAKPKLPKVARRVHRAMAPYFTGKSRGSKMRGIVLGASLDAYVEEYGQFIFCPEDTTKMQENAVSKISRAKVFLKYLTLGWSQVTYWTWEFLFNIPLLKCYPAVLRKTGLAPTTIILYVGQAISFVEFFRATPPKHSRITGGQLVVVIRELRKLSKDLNRTVLGHQALIKQAKGKRLVAREDLARCQALARAKIPSLLEDIEKAAPRDPDINKSSQNKENNCYSF